MKQNLAFYKTLSSWSQITLKCLLDAQNILQLKNMAKFFIEICILDQIWSKRFQSLIQFLEIKAVTSYSTHKIDQQETDG